LSIFEALRISRAKEYWRDEFSVTQQKQVLSGIKKADKRKLINSKMSELYQYLVNISPIVLLNNKIFKPHRFIVK
jgi:hypothetical protein